MLVKDFLEMFNEEDCRYIYVNELSIQYYCFMATDKEAIIKKFGEREVRMFKVGTQNYEEPILTIYLE